MLYSRDGRVGSDKGGNLVKIGKMGLRRHRHRSKVKQTHISSLQLSFFKQQSYQRDISKMSFRPGLFQNAFKAAFPRQTLHRTFHSPQLKTIAVKRPNAISFLFPLTLGTCYMTYHSTRQPVRCDSSILNSLSTGPVPTVGDGQTEPHSSLSGYQLGFGAICGICAGVFVKKGLKALAFILGGAFVFMQVSICTS